MENYINHNLKALDKILFLIKATIEKTEHGIIRLDLKIFDKKITKLKIYGEKSIK